MSKAIQVYLEAGTKRTFAGALDWPGWCRSGRTEEQALEALSAYAERYAAVLKGAGLTFSSGAELKRLEVAERLTGTPTTDFGAPGVAPSADSAPLNDAALAHQTALLVAAWEAFDMAASKARGTRLSVGPRGGGRSVFKIVAHVADADEAYLGALGAKLPSGGDVRTAILEALAAKVHGEPFAVPRKTQRPWSPRYVVRRSAWHALDHAWEMEDRS
ncbi:MAG: hypothetical protein M3P14_09350 [Chloroflexota bacterium]|nr:hypothetical protein [Chloroflexota bacterium]